jgi:hypothetical protein
LSCFTLNSRFTRARTAIRVGSVKVVQFPCLSISPIAESLQQLQELRLSRSPYFFHPSLILSLSRVRINGPWASRPTPSSCGCQYHVAISLTLHRYKLSKSGQLQAIYHALIGALTVMAGLTRSMTGELGRHQRRSSLEIPLRSW